MSTDVGGAPTPDDRDVTAAPVTVLTTGGTIDKVYTLAGELETGSPALHELLDQGRVSLSVGVESVMAKDSLDLTAADRELLLDRVAGLRGTRVVITHGTDTMAETAEYLRERGSAISDKTVVLTGAIQPAAMRDSDAAFNLGAALVAAQTMPRGVFICMHGRIFAAGTTTKDRTTGRFVDVGGAR